MDSCPRRCMTNCRNKARPRLGRTDYSAMLTLGMATTAAGDYTAAERLFRRVLDQEPASNLAEPAHFQLAQLYRKLGRTADADRELKLFQQLRKTGKR